MLLSLENDVDVKGAMSLPSGVSVYDVQPGNGSGRSLQARRPTSGLYFTHDLFINVAQKCR